MARLIITHIQSFIKRQPHINVRTLSAALKILWKLLNTECSSVFRLPFMFQFQKNYTRYFYWHCRRMIRKSIDWNPKICAVLPLLTKVIILCVYTPDPVEVTIGVNTAWRCPQVLCFVLFIFSLAHIHLIKHVYIPRLCWHSLQLAGEGRRVYTRARRI